MGLELMAALIGWFYRWARSWFVVFRVERGRGRTLAWSWSLIRRCFSWTNRPPAWMPVRPTLSSCCSRSAFIQNQSYSTPKPQERHFLNLLNHKKDMFIWIYLKKCNSLKIYKNVIKILVLLKIFLINICIMEMIKLFTHGFFFYSL